MKTTGNGTPHQSILVDGKNLALKHGTGVASYARSLCKNLNASGKRIELLYGEEIDTRYGPQQALIQFFDPGSRKNGLPVALRYPIRHIRRFCQPFTHLTPHELSISEQSSPADYYRNLPPAERFWNAWGAFDVPPVVVQAGRFQSIRNVMNADIAHWTYPVPTRLDDAANIYTLHDLVPLKLPHTTLDNKRAYLAMIGKLVETADMILTVSEQSKSDIHAMFDIPDRKVINTYQDVDIPSAMLGQSDQDVAAAVRGIYGLEPGRYILFYGAIEPKKNVGRLIEAHLASNLDIPLVLAGKDGWLVENELRLYTQHLERRIGPQRIIRLPYVPRDQLINLVRGATAVAFPSLYEGFGLPLVEAMLCNTPVLTSNIGAMREIAGEAAVFVDPYDNTSIRDGLRRITNDQVLRAELKNAGSERARHFSSEKYRERLCAAYTTLG